MTAARNMKASERNVMYINTRRIAFSKHARPPLPVHLIPKVDFDGRKTIINKERDKQTAAEKTEPQWFFFLLFKTKLKFVFVFEGPYHSNPEPLGANYCIRRGSLKLTASPDLPQTPTKEKKRKCIG